MPPRSRKKETSDQLHASHNNTQQESQQERRQPKDSKKKSKAKQSSLLCEGGGETLTHAHDVTSDKSEVITDLGPFLLEQQSEPVQHMDANELTPSRKKRKRKGKNMSTSEGTETNRDFSHNESLLLHDTELVEVEKEESNKLFTEEADSATPRKKVMNLPTSEANVVKSEQCEVVPDLDTLTSKDLDCVLVSQAESFAEENGTDRICSEPESVTPRKKRKGKRKSLSKSEGVEIDHVDELAPKEADPLPLPELATLGEKKESDQLCAIPDSTSPRFEGAEMKDMGSENLDLCPKLDSLPHNESEPAQTEGVGQKKKRRRNKNKGELESEGVKSKRPSDEHSQQCYNAKPTVPEEQNQRKRKRPVMNENQDSSVKPKVTSYMLNSKVVGRASQISRRPLKRYEHYERCWECRQICHGGQTCNGQKHLSKNRQICFFCGTPGHLLGMCPTSPGAKCAKGIIMLDDYVRKKCSERSESMQRKVAPANVPSYAPIYIPVMPDNIQLYPAPFVRPPASFVRPRYAPFVVRRN